MTFVTESKKSNGKPGLIEYLSRSGNEPPQGEPSAAPLPKKPKIKQDETNAQAQRVQQDGSYRLTLMNMIDDLMELHPGAFEFSLNLSVWHSVRSVIRGLLTRVTTASTTKLMIPFIFAIGGVGTMWGQSAIA